MTTTTIRVPSTLHVRLQRLAHEQDRSIGRVIEKLLDDYEMQIFFEELAEDFTRLRADPVASADYDNELTAWDSTLLDGLDDETTG